MRQFAVVLLLLSIELSAAYHDLEGGSISSGYLTSRSIYISDLHHQLYKRGGGSPAKSGGKGSPQETSRASTPTRQSKSGDTRGQNTEGRQSSILPPQQGRVAQASPSLSGRPGQLLPQRSSKPPSGLGRLRSGSPPPSVFGAAGPPSFGGRGSQSAGLGRLRSESPPPSAFGAAGPSSFRGRGSQSPGLGRLRSESPPPSAFGHTGPSPRAGGPSGQPMKSPWDAEPSSSGQPPNTSAPSSPRVELPSAGSMKSPFDKVPSSPSSSPSGSPRGNQSPRNQSPPPLRPLRPAKPEPRPGPVLPVQNSGMDVFAGRYANLDSLSSATVGPTVDDHVDALMNLRSAGGTKKFQ